MVYLQAERVFIPENYFASKTLGDVREAFKNAYPDKEVPNKTTMHRLVTQKVHDCLRDGGGHFLHLLKAVLKFFLSNKNQAARLSCYIYATKITNTLVEMAVLNGTPVISPNPEVSNTRPASSFYAALALILF
jgi:hypothetical protein